MVLQFWTEKLERNITGFLLFFSSKFFQDFRVGIVKEKVRKVLSLLIANLIDNIDIEAYFGQVTIHW